MISSVRRAAAVLAVVGAVAFGLTAAASADVVGPITFESPTYTTGTINGQDGWSSLGAAGSGCAVYDHAVASTASFPGAPASFGVQSLRMSNAVTSGCFGDQTFSKPIANEAGEPGAGNDGLSGGTRQSAFSAEWSFWSTVPGAEQPGLSVVASPDRGDGARMSWVQMTDTPTGLDVNFYDYQDGAVEPAGTCVTGDNFVFSNVASGLSRSVPHMIRIVMQFVPGAGNDVVYVYVDGVLGHTGTSWEDYFRYCEGNPTRTVDSVLFRTGGAAAPATAGNGFLIDGLTTASDACSTSTTGTTITLLADCTIDETFVVPNGFTLNGDGHTITGIDPSGGHFLGAVVQGEAGTGSVTVENLEVTTSGLAQVCDEGVDRLRGILFDGVGGMIRNNTVTHIQQGPSGSGCQEGNAIEVRNAPVDTTGPDVTVVIEGNAADDFIKNGITANGSVAATITGNTVTGNGPVSVPLAAQNGIQIGFGGTAIIRSNVVRDHNYTPESYVACGILYFEADGVRASKNTFSGNERDVCNFGRGGGQYNPTP